MESEVEEGWEHNGSNYDPGDKQSDLIASGNESCQTCSRRT